MPKLSALPDIHPIIEWFELSGVNGYKTLRLETPNCVKIVAAENGTGKTTLLNALYSILTMNISKLMSIEFVSLKLKLRYRGEIVIYKHELIPKAQTRVMRAISELKDLGLSEKKISKNLHYLLSNKLTLDEFGDSEVFGETYYNTHIGRQELLDLYEILLTHSYLNEASFRLMQEVETALDGISVLYLPTFRRIEAEFKLETQKEPDHFVLAYEDDAEDEQLIWFGMNDVVSKLEEFKESIKSITFDSYSTLSAQSLEELLEPSFKRPAPIDPDDYNFKSQLSLVLARLGHAGGQTEAKIDDLIFSEDINEAEYDGLRTHIHRIISIYGSTQQQEQLIESFVSVINSYWRSSLLPAGALPEKEFNFDKFALEVSVSNNITSDVLDLNNLSSGEKQIVAIFAKLYLQQNKKFIVLIDEPELSLAIAWQKRLLVDILESPSCSQLVAITHSPFVFDNELDIYADSMIVKRDLQR